jgi:hypothetical protein
MSVFYTQEKLRLKSPNNPLLFYNIFQIYIYFIISSSHVISNFLANILIKIEIFEF